MWFGPGEYVPDPTEGIIHIRDLPAPEIVAYDRNHEHAPCPRCGHLAYRHKWGHRTLHDLGDLYRNCPIDLLVEVDPRHDLLFSLLLEVSQALQHRPVRSGLARESLHPSGHSHGRAFGGRR